MTFYVLYIYIMIMREERAAEGHDGQVRRVRDKVARSCAVRWPDAHGDSQTLPLQQHAFACSSVAGIGGVNCASVFLKGFTGGGHMVVQVLYRRLAHFAPASFALSQASRFARDLKEIKMTQAPGLRKEIFSLKPLLGQS